MKTKYLGFVMLVIYTLLLQIILFYLFPFPGPTYILTMPITIVVGIILAILLMKLTNKIKTLRTKLFYLFISITLITIISIEIYPLENPLQQIKTANFLHLHPEEVKYEYLFLSNRPVESVYRTAALVKFEDSIPEEAYRITYDYREGPYEFYIAKFRNKYISNNDGLIIEKSSRTNKIIFKDNFNNQKIEFSESEIFGKSVNWGRNGVYFEKVNLKPRRGFNEIYYNLIK